jgi:hypothetical protein
MPPRLLLALAAVALLAVVLATAWALTRPAEERDVPPIRLEGAGAGSAIALVIPVEPPLQEVT